MRVGPMKIALETLLSSVGQAVQESQTCLERQAMETYCRYFHPIEQEGGAGPLTPTVQSFQLPDGKGGYRLVEVPHPALVHHNTMALDTVQVRLHIKSEVEDTGTVMVEVGPDGQKEEAEGDVLELTFRAGPMAEGTARVNQRMIETV